MVMDEAIVGMIARVLCAIVEEIIFRHIIIHCLTQYVDQWTANLLSSALFAIVHLTNPLHMLFVFILAFYFLCPCYESYGLTGSICLHILINLCNTILRYFFCGETRARLRISRINNLKDCYSRFATTPPFVLLVDPGPACSHG